MKNSSYNSAFLLTLAALFLLNTNALSQNSSSDMFIKFKASKQGVVTGGVAEKGKESTIKIISFQNENLSPRDAASGQATGKRQHKPITITKQYDKSSPQLLTAFNTQENLPEVSLRVFGSGKACPDGLCYTIELKDVVISGLTSATNEKGEKSETISFSFQKIEWKYNEASVKRAAAVEAVSKN